MSNVTLQIGGKSYPVACGDGEEAHVTELGAIIDEKFAAMGDGKSPQEVQNFLFAALILADELHNAKKNLADAGSGDLVSSVADDSKLRAEIDQLKKDNASLVEQRDTLAKDLEQALKQAQASEADHQHEMFGEDVLATRLETLATQAEGLADALENQSA